MQKLTSSELMKIQNTKSILRVIHENPGIYRKLIAQKTKLATQTVTNLVKDLLDHGVVREYAMELKGKIRQPMALVINYSNYYILTVDVTVRRILVAINGLDEAIVCSCEEPIVPDLDVLGKIKEMIGRMWQAYGSNKPLEAAVITLMAVVNEDTGVVIQAKKLGWFNVNLQKELEYLDIPLFIRNDVNQIAYSEKISHQNDLNFMVAKLDSGVGSSFVLDKRVLRSTNNVAGELGHVSVSSPDEDIKCSCGKYNCITRFIARDSLARRYGTDYETLRDDVMKNKPDAVALIENACDLLAPVIANTIILLDLDRVILCGCLVEDFENIIYPRMDKNIRERLSYWVAFKSLEVHKNIDPTKMSAQFVIDYYFNGNRNDFLWQ